MKIFVIICSFHFVFCDIDRTWWKNTTLYQVLLPSFKDSDGDGFGDLKGLTSKLDHFVDLGIETILITPHFPSPTMQNAGYDITDYMNVNLLFGSMQDFDDLIKEMKKRGLKLIIDMVINHSGDQHPWFLKSINREEPYTDYYMWKDAKGFDSHGTPIPPNNWFDFYDGSAWQWNEKRKQFYYHQFIPQLADLNLRNNYVMNEFKKIFDFWASKGVAGFRLDAADHLMEDGQFRNEPSRFSGAQEIHGRNDLLNIFTSFVQESFDVVEEIRQFTDNLTEKYAEYERIILPETHATDKELYHYYESKNRPIAQLPFNFWLSYTNQYESAFYYHNVINNYFNCLPKGAIANWDVKNHDTIRRAEVFNEEYEYILTSMVLLLPGVAFIYYGQELGVAGWHFPNEQSTYNAFRLPMQWDDTMNAGFTNSSHPYLQVSLNYRDINVKKQKSEENSHYNKVKKMISWRKTDLFKYGSFKSYVVSYWVFAFTRTLGEEQFLVIFNLGHHTEYVNLKNSIEKLPDVMKIQLASRNSDYKTRDEITTNEKMMLKAQVAVVLSRK